LLKKITKNRIGKYAVAFDVFQQIIHQKKSDSDKVYSVHEPDVQCISKGMEYKKYEFGCKVSLAVTKDSGICVGAMSFVHPAEKNARIPSVHANPSNAKIHGSFLRPDYLERRLTPWEGAAICRVSSSIIP
jgi:hypothetical protein